MLAGSSHQSLSVGHLISFAIELGKPTIIIYEETMPKPNFFPSLVKENDIYLFRIAKVKILKNWLLNILSMEDTDIRFNLMLSAEMYNYLNQIAKQEKLPKSVIVRRLIAKDKLERN